MSCGWRGVVVLQNGPVSIVQVHEVGVVLSNVKEHVRKYLSLGL